MDKAGRLGMAVHQAASFSPPLMGLTASRAVTKYFTPPVSMPPT